MTANRSRVRPPSLPRTQRRRQSCRASSPYSSPRPRRPRPPIAQADAPARALPGQRFRGGRGVGTRAFLRSFVVAVLTPPPSLPPVYIITHYQRSLAARGAGDVRRGIALPLLVSRVQRVVADASHGEQEALAKNLKTRTIPISRPTCGRYRVPAACRGTYSA